VKMWARLASWLRRTPRAPRPRTARTC
jgi:hypothetical protein